MFKLTVQLIFFNVIIVSTVVIPLNGDLIFPKSHGLNQSVENRTFYPAHETMSKKHHRAKRFIHLNPYGTFTLGVKVVTPLIIVLPMWSSLFNTFRRKRRRREISRATSNTQCRKNSTPGADYIVVSQIHKLQEYFRLLEIPEIECQFRTLCELSSNTNKFRPISDFMISIIQNDGMNAVYYQADNTNYTVPYSPVSVFLQYNLAIELGYSYGDKKCLKKYGKSCPYSVEMLLNMEAIRMWNSFSTRLNFEFNEEFKNN